MHDVIVGVDRSETARRAAVEAARMAADWGANLHVVMAVQPGTSRELVVGSDRFRVDWLARAEEHLAQLVQTLPHRSTTWAVTIGDPARTLCDEAARLQARALVVGDRRTRGVARLLGSVAAEVTRLAPCPVVVARTTGRG